MPVVSLKEWLTCCSGGTVGRVANFGPHAKATIHAKAITVFNVVKSINTFLNILNSGTDLNPKLAAMDITSFLDISIFGSEPINSTDIPMLNMNGKNKAYLAKYISACVK